VEANELFCKKVKAKHLYTNLLQNAVMTQCNAESVLSINDSTSKYKLVTLKHLELKNTEGFKVINCLYLYFSMIFKFKEDLMSFNSL
jgi:hypothetical protein